LAVVNRPSHSTISIRPHRSAHYCSDQGETRCRRTNIHRRSKAIAVGVEHRPIVGPIIGAVIRGRIEAARVPRRLARLPGCSGPFQPLGKSAMGRKLRARSPDGDLASLQKAEEGGEKFRPHRDEQGDDAAQRETYHRAGGRAARQQLLFCAHNLAFQCLPRRDLARTEVTLVTWRLQQTAALANLMSALGRKRKLAT